MNTGGTKQSGILNTGKLNLLLVILSVLLAAGYLIFNSYSDARQVHGTTTKVLRDQQLKRVLLASMFSASRKRSLILLEMVAEEDAFEKLRYDLYYIKNYSITLDLIIVLETVKVVLFGRGGR